MFYKGREMIITAFKNEIFLFYHERSEFEIKIKMISGMKIV